MRLLIRRPQWLVGLGLVVGAVSFVAAPGRAGILDALWTAPTTNTDGSPLTDLASYRVYYGASSAPCPGAFFFQVASSTPSPPPNQTVTFRLTGVSAGTLYNVSVTAVDTSGNQSVCSTLASAIARIDFGVSPTGTVNFGAVNLGGFVDRVFAVSNTGGGTVSGTVSTSAPFSIVSGSPFSLVGLGATQTVTVRFIPITSATATVNLNASADGDTVSRILTGTGIALDTTPPIVAITSPTSGSTYTTSNPLLTLGGTASDNVWVTQVTWANSLGSSGTASGTTIWTTGGMVLRLGTNVLTVTARDAAGNTATAGLTVTLTPFTFTDDPLMAQNTVIRALHITELRAAIDTVRVANGMATFAWTDATLTPGSIPVSVIQFVELRRALDEAYQAAGRMTPTYTDPNLVAGVTGIKAIHLNELRTTVRVLE